MSEDSQIRVLSTDTDTLTFADFSFLGADGDVSLANASTEHRKMFDNYMAETFDAYVAQYSAPFMVISCGSDMPPKDKLPFSVAGWVAVWKSINDPSIFIPMAGELGSSDKEICLSEDMLDRMKPCTLPPDDILLYLANNVFTDSIAISVMQGSLVIELPKTGELEFIERLGSLPCAIKRSPFICLYFNGQLPNTPRGRSREVTPRAKYLDNLVVDETDYARQDGKFFPGAMLSSIDAKGNISSSVTAGVLVQKDGERRLTCSWHNWEKHDEQHPGLFGQPSAEAHRVFRVALGTARHDDTSHNANEESEPGAGTAVGFVRERIGETDIALAQVADDVAFENTFVGIPAAAKKFVLLQDQNAGDRYMIDSFVTGKQSLYGYGARAAFARKRRPDTHPDDQHDPLPPDGVAHIQCKQGIYATNAPIIAKEPETRDRACGSVLVRSRLAKDADKSDILERGEISGMVHFADLQPRNDGSFVGYLVYADTFDPLVKAGWDIATEDTAAEEKADERDDRLEGSPAKKQRRA